MANPTPATLAFSLFEPQAAAKSDRVPVIFLHCMSTGKESWLDVPQHVADSTGRTVYAVDQRNHGDSPWSEEWSFGLNAVDILAFMDDQDISKAVLVGHNMGGITAYKAALKAPERIGGLFIEDISTRPFAPEMLAMMKEHLSSYPQLFAQIPAESDEEGAATFIYNMMKGLTPPEFKVPLSPEIVAAMARLKRTEDGGWTCKANLQVLVKGLQSPEEVLLPYEGVYKGPVCVACGEASPFKACEDGDLIRENFPNAEIVTFKGATHFLHIESPDELKNLLVEFLQKPVSE